MKINPTLLEITITLILCLTIYVWLRYGKKLKRLWKEWRKHRRGPRQLHPKEPGDCSVCVGGIHWLTRKLKQDVVPWSEHKSSRGRKKEIDTHGHGCLNPRCDYFGLVLSASILLGRRENRWA